MIASRATAENAMFWAESRLLAQMMRAEPSSPGASSAHWSACMPPRDPPTAASGRAMPRWVISARWTLTRSLTVKIGKRSP